MNELHELFCLRPWDERTRVACENMSQEIDRPEDVLKRSTFCALADKFPQGGSFRFAERTFKIKVELDSLLLFKNVSQQVFGVQPGAFDSLLFKKA